MRESDETTALRNPTVHYAKCPMDYQHENSVFAPQLEGAMHQMAGVCEKSTTKMCHHQQTLFLLEWLMARLGLKRGLQSVTVRDDLACAL
mmetsp:Transcript_24448/g.61007  ORF Transcript_24448/g.61007 Transcript_24448/m.61007 type:complete len:90 (+) Transcript_24448:2755-3024(+)